MNHKADKLYLTNEQAIPPFELFIFLIGFALGASTTALVITLALFGGAS